MPKYLKELISVFSILIIVGVENAYREPLYKYSIKVTLKMQKWESQGWTNFYLFISFFGYEIGLGIVFILAYVFSQRRTFIKLLLAFFVSQSIIAFFKAFYHSPRPYFTEPEIHALDCATGYGNPSGHAVIVPSIYGTFWLLMFFDITKDDDPLNANFLDCCSKVVQLIIIWSLFILLVLLIIFTFIARIYLGAHSLNQVVYGLTIGLWAMYTFGVVTPPYIDRHMTLIVEYKRQFVITKGNSSLFFIFIVLQALNIALYLKFQNSQRFYPKSWKAQIHAKCSNVNENVIPLQESFKATVLTSLYVFLYLSQLLSAILFPNVFRCWHYNVGFIRWIGRLLVTIIILAPFFVPYEIVKNGEFIMQIMVGIVMVSLLVGFFGIVLVDWICLALGFVNILPILANNNIKNPAIPPEKHPAKTVPKIVIY